ncbi:MAG TPA: hypothetical protein PKC43_02845 [Phycisphaerales bacterium]|nr:hypothetical protein [Phycisphaerales bacterium]HMP36364.1 hypothetical protein [Phycisphaerales bacterium]
MKLVATIVVALSLTLGLVAAATAYLVPLGLPDERLVGLTSIETVPDPGDPGAFLVRKGDALDVPTLAALRAAGGSRIRVEEFSFGRWRERWFFLLAAAGLLAGSFLARAAARSALDDSETAGAMQADAAEGAAAIDLAPGAVPARGAPESPERLLMTIEGTVDDLLQRWPSLGSAATRSDAVRSALDPIVDGVIPAFAAARPRLVARVGIGGYASLMDRFAAAERQIHRAWSAAADGVPDESHDCLLRAVHLLEEARARLTG